MSQNILTQDIFETPYQTPPFEQIKLEDYKPAFEQAIAEAKAEIDAITENPNLPDFFNTIEALSLSGEKLNRISSIFFNLNSAETNDEMQALAQEISPLLSEFSSDISLNKALFERIQKVYDSKPEGLTPEQQRLLDKTYKNFSRNGALLSEKGQERLRQIDQELSLLSLQFGQNVLAATNEYILHITDEKALEGLPQDEIDAAKETAEEKSLDGWAITLQMPSYLGFMKYAKNRNLREKLYRANGTKNFAENKFNNAENVLKIIKLRAERAHLLGYKNHAAFVLEERMAQSPENVQNFLEDLLQKAKPFGQEEIKKLGIYAQEKEGINELMPWDHAYFAEAYKKENFSLSDQELKPFFQLEKVIDGTFEIAGKLYNLSFKEVNDIEKYHADVRTFHVMKENEIIGILYTDFFPRAGKRPGAWMTSYRDGYFLDGEHKIPQISIVCNFTKPTAEKPSLLTFSEVTTLFHEFGHALHGLLANTQYASLAGTNVYWDFVELPSQFMENFCYEPEALQLFAKHYQTGEVIPQDLIDKIVAASQFMEGYQTLRQLGFGLLDMAWHTTEPEKITNLAHFERENMAETQLYPSVEGTNMSTAFSHIFQGGYAAGYYSYKWAEVLDADAFDYFKQNGIFNPEIAKKFYTLLSSGGTVDPMQLYVAFRGKKPSNSALLKRAGLVK
ncbi:M3 family peptidase [Ornithobacterium rhinotracheale]|uniref:M3 family metallopeptidase n=1 Tax=Ornithobacterium rhinotracheale TaxID=28251 RepID=UPI00129C4094|nr:M3 family metallopeptidase [Ornithobacterium rhinotracheale]MRI63745.1 M3 family peptidase [Ornithobacterium rhinotracheale]